MYIAGDGASWIKTGVDVISKSRFVLDKFHIMKYINASVAHLENSEEIKECLWEYINGAHKQDLRAQYREILKVTDSPSKHEEVKKALNYFMNNWEGIEIRDKGVKVLFFQNISPPRTIIQQFYHGLLEAVALLITCIACVPAVRTVVLHLKIV